MSREAFGDPPESQEAPDLCPVCGNDWHAEDCEFGKEVARRLKAERDAHKLAHENEQLRRLSSLDAMRAGKLAEDVERYSALHARLFAEKTAAQIGAENMRELLFRMLEAPTTQISPSWKEEIRKALVAPDCKTTAGCRKNGCLGWCDEYRPDPALKPDIAALKRRLAEDPGFAAQVTGDRPPTPVGWSDTDWLKHLEEIRQDQAVYHRGPLPETGWD